MNIAEILKTIGKNILTFLVGAIMGLIVNITLVFPSAIQKIATEKDVGLGIIALAPALFIIYGIISIVIGGFLAIVIYNIIKRKKRNKMKWIGISGGWRKTNQEIENKVRNTVREIMQRGDGIVSGGALGVDSIALDEALKNDLKAERIKIFIPTTLEKYAEHYRKHTRLKNITSEQAENLINQLKRLKQTNPQALIENPDTNFTEETKRTMYYERNSKVVDASDELVAFRVRTKASEGLGTADTAEKAKKKGIPVKIFSYDLSSEKHN